MNNDVCNRIHVARQRAASAGGAAAEGVYSGCRPQIAGGRALCPPGTDSSGRVGDGTSAVALSAAEEGSGFRDSGDSWSSIAVNVSWLSTPPRSALGFPAESIRRLDLHRSETN